MPFDEAEAHRAGALLARSRTKDVVDASVVTLAISRGADIVSDETGDIMRLLGIAHADIAVLEV